MPKIMLCVFACLLVMVPSLNAEYIENAVSESVWSFDIWVGLTKSRNPPKDDIGTGGMVYLSDVEMPLDLKHILTPIGEFEYVEDSQMWFKVDESKEAKKIKDKAKLQKDYFYHFPAKKWVAPDAIADYIKKLLRKKQ